MKKNKIFILIMLLCVVGFASCDDDGSGGKPPDIPIDTMDYNNIENLYEQPLEVIQKCVVGKWKVLGRNLYLNPSEFGNTFVNITNDSVVFTLDMNVFDSNIIYHPHWQDGFYNWEFKNNHFGSYGNETYVLIYNYYDINPPNPPEEIGWVFLRIQNDTLFGEVYTPAYSWFYRPMHFLRIRDGG